MPFVLPAFNPEFADSDEFGFFLLSFCKNFFLPASFSAFRAFHVSRPPNPGDIERSVTLDARQRFSDWIYKLPDEREHVHLVRNYADQGTE